MATVIRLARKGRAHEAIYSVVVADSRSPRDGKFIENVGYYNPNTNPVEISFENAAVVDWMVKGAQPSDTVKSLLKQSGVYPMFMAARKGEDVSNFVVTPKAVKDIIAKPSKKALAKIEADKAAAAEAAAAAAAAEAAPAEEAAAE